VITLRHVALAPVAQQGGEVKLGATISQHPSMAFGCWVTLCENVACAEIPVRYAGILYIQTKGGYHGDSCRIYQ
jgi:hypothetical protein